MSLNEDASNLTQLLADLVAFPTVSGDHLAAKDCLTYLETYLVSRGMVVQNHDSGGFTSLVATTHATKTPKVLLQAHLDVVPCPSDLFNLTEKGGKLLGRGTYDMKFAAAVFLKLVDELQGDLASYDFGIMFTFDEEVGGENGVKALLEVGYRTRVCVLPDAGDNWHIETTHKGAWIARLSTKGMAAHGSRPWDGDNAIHRLIDALQAVSQLFKDQHSDSDTLSINKISGGRAVNQVADSAEATIDIRFLSNNLYDQLRQKIEVITAKYKIKVETIACVKCVQTNMKNPYVKSFLQVSEQVHGHPIQTIRSLGASDAHYFDDFNIPTVLLRPDGGGAHSDSEWIDKASLEQYYELIKAYIQKEAKA